MLRLKEGNDKKRIKGSRGLGIKGSSEKDGFIRYPRTLEPFLYFPVACG
jgi:hypothetical protein